MKLALSLVVAAITTSVVVVNGLEGEEVCLDGVCTESADQPSNTTTISYGDVTAPIPPTLEEEEEDLFRRQQQKKKVFSPSKCGLYIAPSILRHGPGVFTAVDIEEGEMVGEPDMFLSVLDRFKTVPYRGQHRWMSWLDYVRGTTNYRIPKNIPQNEMEQHMLRRSSTGPQFWYDFHRLDAINFGLGSEANVHPTMNNIKMNENSYKHDNVGLHRSTDPGVGAFSSHHNVEFMATSHIEAGSELFLKPTEEEFNAYWSNGRQPDIDHTVTTRWLESHGKCIDNLKYGPSNIRSAGRGAFAKRSLQEGELIAPSAVAVLKREVLKMYQSHDYPQTFSQVLNKHKVEGIELVLNYCFGHPDSDILLLPVSPIVNYMNHYADYNESKDGKKREPNVRIEWPENTVLADEPHTSWFDKHPTELLDLSGMIQIHYVALRDIEEDEELVLDYGKEWQAAWEKHVDDYDKTVTEEDENYTTAIQYIEDNKFKAKTLIEQESDPYPSNLQTICHFTRGKKKKRRVIDGIEDNTPPPPPKKCWLPCDIIDREKPFLPGGEETYVATFSSKKHIRDGYQMDSWKNCVTKKTPTKWTQFGLTAFNITIMDKWDSADQLQRQPESDEKNNKKKQRLLFRHAISVPDGFFPGLWIKESAEYEIMPMDEPRQLKPGEYRHITWRHNGQPITRNAYMIGLPHGFNQKMREFAERQGAMEMFRSTLNGRPNKNGKHRFVDLKDGEWYVQRPHWNSNMHWIIPFDENARQAYLQQLGEAGFDIILNSIGTGMGMNKLTCFHNTLLGISQADDSNMHADFYETQRRSFDFLTPIIMADNSTDPEFHLQSRDGNIIVNIKYNFGTAVIMGDWTYHKSAPVDYYAKEDGDIRVVCSIYCSEITAENRDSLLKMYQEEAPAPFYNLFDIPVQEWHWDTRGATLPRKPKVSDQF
mmetsp:Transcript_23743/g.26205  ORF Transcript_23743/g.26205 Transcript_23743/m.26205 type:complete len:932 (+) Transcript_23743:64-2859(+)